MGSASKDFILQRICIFAGEDINPNDDKQVQQVLRNRFDINLPQRRSLDESLASTASDHEIVDLILKYRTT